ncbi:MAG: hypothetical protein IKX08_02810, partial [Lachnospiraceae bacterium]|nr:hypothetical protein [Lachnospiraceae bacterium]
MEKQEKRKKRISIVLAWHYFRLIYRSVLFILILITYIRFRFHSQASIIESIEQMPTILIVTWAIFVVEMIFRFFPSKL